MVAIYKISNTVNDKIYIGGTTKFTDRKRRHLSELKKGSHCNKNLQKFFNSFGISYLRFEILEQCQKENLLVREQFYLDKYFPLGICFNVCPVAGNTTRVNHSDATKDKIRQRAIGRVQSLETIQKRVLKNTGKKRPESAKETVREKLSKLTDEQVIEIKTLLKQGYYQHYIARKFGVCQRNISRIHQGISYTHVKL